MNISDLKAAGEFAKTFGVKCLVYGPPDSVSQLADVYLQQSLKDNKHGMKAYGEMAESTMAHLRTLYYTKEKHTYLICKEETKNLDNQTVRRPYFPGQVLPIDIPHMYDIIARLAKTNVPGQLGEVLAFQCVGNMNVLARNRTGNLNEFEEPNFSKLV